MTTRKARAMSDRLFVERILRGSRLLPRLRQQIFDRLYVRGESPQQVRESLGLDEKRFEQERAAALRSLMRVS